MSFSRATKGLNCPWTLNDHVVTMDHVNDPLKSSVLEEVQCNVMLQKKRVTSAVLREAAKAGYENCQCQHSSIDRTETREISEKRSSDATRTTHGRSREAIRKGLHVKLGFLLAPGLPQISLQAETYSGDSDLLSCIEERGEHKDAQSLTASLVPMHKEESKLTFSSYNCHADSTQR